MSKLYYNHGNYPSTEIGLTLEDAQSVSHPGPCDEDVEALAQVPYVAEQLAKISAGQLHEELEEYGAWDYEQLSDHQENLLRWLWLSGCDIAVDAFMEKEVDDES